MAESDEICPTCVKKEGEANHPPGMIFVGWGTGWQTCPDCLGTGKKQAAPEAQHCGHLASVSAPAKPATPEAMPRCRLHDAPVGDVGYTCGCADTREDWEAARRDADEGSPRVPDDEIVRGVAFERRAGRCGGQWVLKNTRMTVGTLVWFYTSGKSIEDIHALYPHLPWEHVEAAVSLPKQLGKRWVSSEEHEGDETASASDQSPWFGVWCTQDGNASSGHWRVIRNTLEPLQTTRTEAERTATVLNEGAAERTDAVGWRYEVRPYVPASASVQPSAAEVVYRIRRCIDLSALRDRVTLDNIMAVLDATRIGTAMPARLDASGMAKPLTEIAGVFPDDGRCIVADGANAIELVVRDTPAMEQLLTKIHALVKDPAKTGRSWHEGIVAELEALEPEIAAVVAAKT